MLKIKRILLATDLSPCAMHADTRAAMIAAELRCDELHLMHVIDPSLPGALERLLKDVPGSDEIFMKEHAEHALQAIAVRLQGINEIACQRHVAFGRPASKINEKANEISADIVVVGAHGCNAITELFIGNTPYKLLHIGSRPLLIVKNQPQCPYQNILVPVDFSSHSKQAALTAMAIAPNAHVTLLHGFGMPQDGLMQDANVSHEFILTYRSNAKDIAAREMEHFIATLDAGDRVISWTHQFGYPPFVIREYVEKNKPDLIVMGKHGQTRIEDFLLGSVTRSTIDNTTCDILITLPFDRQLVDRKTLPACGMESSSEQARTFRIEPSCRQASRRTRTDGLTLSPNASSMPFLKFGKHVSTAHSVPSRRCQRCIAAAFVIAQGRFDEKLNVFLMLLTASLVSMTVVLIAGGEFSRRARNFEKDATERDV